MRTPLQVRKFFVSLDGRSVVPRPLCRPPFRGSERTPPRMDYCLSRPGAGDTQPLRSPPKKPFTLHLVVRFRAICTSLLGPLSLNVPPKHRIPTHLLCVRVFSRQNPTVPPDVHIKSIEPVSPPSQVPGSTLC